MKKKTTAKAKETSVTLRKGELHRLYLLIDVPLHGDIVRKRSKFMNIIDEQLNSIIKSRDEILKSYANKDEKGNAIVKNGLYDIKEEDKSKVLDDVKVLFDEEITINVEKDLIRSIVDILSKYPHDMKIDEGKQYSEMMEKLEKA